MISAIINLAIFSVKQPKCFRRVNTSPPCTYSIIRYIFFSVWIQYLRETTNGLEDRRRIVFSRIIASISYNFTMSNFRIDFIAYFRSVSFFVTKKTYPNAPFPNALSITKSAIVRPLPPFPLLLFDFILEQELSECEDYLLDILLSFVVCNYSALFTTNFIWDSFFFGSSSTRGYIISIFCCF